VFYQNRDARIELCTSLAARIEIWNWTVLREKVTAITVTVIHVTTKQHCVYVVLNHYKTALCTHMHNGHCKCSQYILECDSEGY
jgi:hypothetical protein